MLWHNGDHPRDSRTRIRGDRDEVGRDKVFRHSCLERRSPPAACRPRLRRHHARLHRRRALRLDRRRCGVRPGPRRDQRRPGAAPGVADQDHDPLYDLRRAEAGTALAPSADPGLGARVCDAAVQARSSPGRHADHRAGGPRARHQVGQRCRRRARRGDGRDRSRLRPCHDPARPCTWHGAHDLHQRLRTARLAPGHQRPRYGDAGTCDAARPSAPVPLLRDFRVRLPRHGTPQPQPPARRL